MKVFKFFILFDFSSINFKKMLSIFLISSLLFSGFIPKNQEFKNNFISALNCAVNTIETNFYDQYLSAVMSVVNCVSNIFNNIETVVETQLSEQQNQQKDNKSSIPVNTSSDDGIIVQNNINSQIGMLKVNLYETININKIYNFYESVKINNIKNVSSIGILFFILFNILVVRIKDTIAVLLNNEYRILNRLG